MTEEVKLNTYKNTVKDDLLEKLTTHYKECDVYNCDVCYNMEMAYRYIKLEDIDLNNFNDKHNRHIIMEKMHNLVIKHIDNVLLHTNTKYKPNITYVDIDVYSKTFPDFETGKDPIKSIMYIDETGLNYLDIATDDDNYTTEIIMLSQFIKNVVANSNINYSWFATFDFNYMIARCSYLTKYGLDDSVLNTIKNAFFIDIVDLYKKSGYKIQSYILEYVIKNNFLLNRFSIGIISSGIYYAWYDKLNPKQDVDYYKGAEVFKNDK